MKIRRLFPLAGCFLAAIWCSSLGPGGPHHGRPERASGLPGALAAEPAAPPVVIPTERIALFNGKDLAPFYSWLAGKGTADPDHVFSVVDRIDGAPAIRISGQGFGGLTTRQEYAEYRLVVEFRWGLLTWGSRGGRARDSGVLVHCQGRDGNTGRDFSGPWMRSIEAQIIEGGVGDFILVEGRDENGQRITPTMTATAGMDRDGESVYDPEGAPREFRTGRINWFGRDPDWADRFGYRGRQDVESPTGEWNRFEVVCTRDGITNILNGKTVNVGQRPSITQGKIILQSEGAELYFRRVDLEPLGR
jgi:3-keto-disaccharide hydrolase